MLRYDNPFVVVTRPQAGSDSFVAALAQTGAQFRPVISPAFETVATQATIAPFEDAVFTSMAGVAFAPQGDGRRAYCVGDATAQAARGKGYDAISAGGNADDLIALILQHRPARRLMHLRGAVSEGDVTGALRAAGCDSREVVIYRKEVCAPKKDMIAALSSKQAVLIPVFSAETVSILGRWSLDTSKAIFIAMSDNVAAAARGLAHAEVKLSQTPTLAGMVDATRAMVT